MDFDLGESWCAGMDAAGACELFWELGPPPDMILRIPPPPLPAFLESMLFTQPDDFENASCHWCEWAKSGDSVDYVELPRQGPTMNDTWFFVILASCILLTLMGVLLTFAYLRFKGKLLKGDLDFLGSDKCKDKLDTRACETVLYPHSTSSHSVYSATRLRDATNTASIPYYEANQEPHHATENTWPSSRALWAGVKTSNEGNHYTIAHAQPLEQKKPELLAQNNPSHLNSIAAANYDYVEYGSVGYTTLSPTATKDAGLLPPKSPSTNDAHNGTCNSSTDRTAKDPNTETHQGSHIYANTLREWSQQNQNNHVVIMPITNMDNEEESHSPVTPETSKSPKRSPLSLAKLKSTLDIKPNHLRRKVGETPVVSSPTLIASPNLPPLNQRRNQHTSPQSNARKLAKPQQQQTSNNRRQTPTTVAPDSDAIYSELSNETPEEAIYASPIDPPNKLHLMLHTPPVSPYTGFLNDRHVSFIPSSAV